MARLSLDEVLTRASASTRRLNPGLFHAGGSAPAPVAQPGNRHGALAASPPKVRDTRKRLVQLKSYRVRLLDEDNLVGKFHVDSLRYAGLLPGDDPSQARIQVSQEKVATRKEERTEIRVTILLD